MAADALSPRPGAAAGAGGGASGAAPASGVTVESTEHSSDDEPPRAADGAVEPESLRFLTGEAAAPTHDACRAVACEGARTAASLSSSWRLALAWAAAWSCAPHVEARSEGVAKRVSESRPQGLGQQRHARCPTSRLSHYSVQEPSPRNSTGTAAACSRGWGARARGGVSRAALLLKRCARRTTRPFMTVVGTSRNPWLNESAALQGPARTVDFDPSSRRCQRVQSPSRSGRAALSLRKDTRTAPHHRCTTFRHIFSNTRRWHRPLCPCTARELTHQTVTRRWTLLCRSLRLLEATFTKADSYNTHLHSRLVARVSQTHRLGVCCAECHVLLAVSFPRRRQVFVQRAGGADPPRCRERESARE